MNDTSTITRSGDENLRAVAVEIHRAAPAPHSWESLDTASVGLVEHRSTGLRRGLLAVAAVSILVVGVAGTIMVTSRNVPASAPAASDELPAVRPPGRPWTPVIEQPALTPDVDAIEVTGDAADWVDRALFPLETPNGYTFESVSQGVGGAMTEQGGVDTGDVSVRLISTTPAGTASDPLIVIATVPAGIGSVEIDVEPETVLTGADLKWDVYVEEGPEGSYQATSYARTQGPSGMVSYTGIGSASEALAETEVLLSSLRLVRVGEIPTEVVDLNRLPVVATVSSGDVAGFLRATHTTNGWCLVSMIGNGGVTGCGFRLDPAFTSAVFVDVSWSDEGVVTLAGMAAPGVATIEIDLTDGTTVTVQPTFPEDADGGIGFWAASHRYDGPIGTDGPVVATRTIAADGDVIGAVEGP